MLNLWASELSSDQLESLSECDYFKYTTCTANSLTIGACIKTKYDEFVRSCGSIHAKKYTYSREMFKPVIDLKKKSKKSCESVQYKLCGKSGLSLSQCASKFNKEIGAACGKEFMEVVNSKEVKKIDECFAIREKECGKEIDPECDERFKRKAPKFCISISTNSKSSSKGVPSDTQLLGDCSKTIKDKCNLDKNELLKEEVNAAEYIRKYQICVERAIKNATGKCGKHFDVDSKVKEYSK